MASSVANARRTYELRAKNVDPALRRSTLTSTVSARRATFTFLDNSSAPSRPDFSAFFHSTHSAFSLRANAEAGTADHDTDTRRSRPFLNNSASFRGRLLNDVVVRKAWRHNESCQGGTGQDCSHKKSPFEFPNDFASTRMKLLGSRAQSVASFDLVRYHRANKRIFLYAFDLIELNGVGFSLKLIALAKAGERNPDILCEEVLKDIRTPNNGPLQKLRGLRY